MAFNGNGVFLRLYNWTNDAAANIKIRADRMDNETNGIATGLSTCITKDGQTTITANLPMAGFRHTGVADAVNKQDYYTLNQAMNGTGPTAAIIGGTGDVITLGFSPSYIAYTSGMKVSFVAGANNTTNVTVNIDSLGAKALTKNGTTPLVAGDIVSGALYQIQYDGTEFQLLNPSAVTALSNKVSKSGDTMTGTLVMSGTAINEAKGTDIVSATSTLIGAAIGNYVNVTGTTTITSFDTVQAGTRRIITFTGILILTYNATSLILPTSANITTAVGDTATFVSLGSGNWVCIGYQRKDGSPLLFSAFTGDSGSGGIKGLVPAPAAGDTLAGKVLGAAGNWVKNIFYGTAVATTSAVLWDFAIPVGTRRIKLMFYGVSTNGSSPYLVKLLSGGTAGSYNSTAFQYNSGTYTTSTAGFVLNQGPGAAAICYGEIDFTLVDAAVNQNLWTSKGIQYTSGIAISAGGGQPPGVVDTIRLTTVNGTDTFDAGILNITYES